MYLTSCLDITPISSAIIMLGVHCDQTLSLYHIHRSSYGVMGCQVHVLVKVIRPLFADAVTILTAM